MSESINFYGVVYKTDKLLCRVIEILIFYTYISELYFTLVAFDWNHLKIVKLVFVTQPVRAHVAQVS